MQNDRVKHRSSENGFHDSIGETDPAALAALGDKRLRATPAEWSDALGACTELNPVYRRLVRLALDELQLLEQQIGQLDQQIASLLREPRSNDWRKSPV